MASPPPPPSLPTSAAAAAAGNGRATSTSPVDALFLQNLMSRVQLRPPFLDTNSFLTQDLDDFLLNEFAALSAAAGASDDEEEEEEDEEGRLAGGEGSGEARRRRMLAREEAKLEREIVRMVLAGEAEEKLKPNSGQSVAVGDHHLCVGFHDEVGGEYRVWEWHGHVMLFDDEDGYSAEYIYGNHFEPLAAAAARAKKKEKEKREKDLSMGLRDLVVGTDEGGNGGQKNGSSGGPRVVRRNVVNSPAAPASQVRKLKFTGRSCGSGQDHLMKWTAAGETMTSDGSRLRGSKRIKTTTAAETAQAPQHGLRCNAKPTRNQSTKAPCKRSQKLGDKITALQQLVSPYGKTDTASVLHEAATCIKHLHEQIQILTASYPAISSPASQQDTGEEKGASDLRRRGLCLAPLSPDVVKLVASAEAALRHRDTADTEDRWRWLGTL
ncbi:hypothetical protein BAE44_0026137 [Dichanthelium oligosanthes]|uniref:BHLH domain-containing protein n=1 Tax=Dichanthelium oligosanthes TaxID=888268 RepID=A0A1E5UIZ2_9POAL|nr:hypothetical protein BAE44_0026137 [Dichanthelium oligosanthes]